MFPGTTSKLSESAVTAAATINPKTDMIRVSGATAIVNIVPNFGGGFSGILFVVPLAVFTWTAAGNISIAGTSVINKMIVFVYSKVTGKWYPSVLA